MRNARTSFRAAEMDATLPGGVIGDKRAFAALEGNLFASEIAGNITWISGPSRAPGVRQAATLGL